MRKIVLTEEEVQRLIKTTEGRLEFSQSFDLDAKLALVNEDNTALRETLQEQAQKILENIELDVKILDKLESRTL